MLQLVDGGGAENGYAQLVTSLQKIDSSKVGLAMGVGLNYPRQRLFDAIQSHCPNAFFPPIVHSTAWVSPSARLRPASVVLAHSSIGARSRLGVGAVLNTGASLDHDSELRDFASLGPGARTGGNVRVGSRTMIGLQAGILHGRTVGKDSVIGAQSLVLEDMPSLSVAVGSPARVIRSRERDEPYY